MSVIRSLVVSIESRTAKFTRGIEDSGKQLKSFEKNVYGTQRALKGLAAAAGVALLARMGKQAIDAGAELHHLSEQIGFSAEALSEYKHVAEQANVSFEALAMGSQRMVRRIAEAAQGTGEAKGALEELNLNARKLAQLSPEDQLMVMAEALSGVKDEGDQVRLAMKLFDSEGVKFLRFLKQGPEGLAKMREEAHKLGITLTNEQAAAMAEAQAALKNMGASGDALANSLAVNLGPTVADVANFLSDNLPAATDIAKDAFNGLRHAVYEIVRGVASGLEEYYRITGNFFNSIEDLDTADRLKTFIEELDTSYNNVVMESERITQQFTSSANKGFKAVGVSISEASKEAERFNDEVDTMSRAMDMIDRQFEELEEDAAREFAGLEDMSRETWRSMEGHAVIYSEKVEDVNSRAMDSFIDDLARGELSFSKFVTSIINEWLRYAQAVSNGQSASGGGGILGAVLNGFLPGAGAAGAVPSVGFIDNALFSSVGGGAPLLDPGLAISIPKLDTGTNRVPQDMLAMIHEGEAVVPKEYNPAAGGATGMAGNVTINMNVNAGGTGSFTGNGSGKQIQFARMLSNLVAGEIRKQQQPGGLLA